MKTLPEPEGHWLRYLWRCAVRDLRAVLREIRPSLSTGALRNASRSRERERVTL